MNAQLSAEGSSASTTDDFSIESATVRGLAKYPFNFGLASISPMLGVEWFPCLSGRLSGVSFDSQPTATSHCWAELSWNARFRNSWRGASEWSLGTFLQVSELPAITADFSM